MYIRSQDDYILNLADHAKPNQSRRPAFLVSGIVGTAERQVSVLGCSLDFHVL